MLACILGLTALVGMGLTIGGVASDNNTMTAIGLSMVAVPALISGGMAVACFGAWGTMVIGAGTIIAGVGQGNTLITTFSYRTLTLAKMSLYGLL